MMMFWLEFRKNVEGEKDVPSIEENFAVYMPRKGNDVLVSIPNF